ncbi:MULTISPECIES: CaiB/BaiF CoA-transferase family protein [Mycobacteriaceae]|uniref:CaiB/BaiF CoA-transferase family protein n=1 Tax=Mycobacteriaceae TaxID=1762 RepID=UPI00031763DB|nr:MULTISPECIES: CoA transferase [Mycobacteriaceae]AHC25936.2 acyl-CoA transferase [Mycolicibacterium neoaurum VKM Ac-1815D]AMO06340.1 acyl-CoA transferase [Mycolicibacterium neoaurum]AXK75314.1 CoA transferase [Mycolicibacterium neoaurum]KJQ51014.1 acyl-CoA transferase [Mycolicibacterium neoaurum]KUM08321.1 acyl-CoA transferase [Mycolicibacterium neoaurum]
MTAGQVLLDGVRVLDAAGPDGAAVTRLLADLGADVLKVDALRVDVPGRDDSLAPPLVESLSVPHTLDNANKRCLSLDPAADTDRDRFHELVAGADILVADGRLAAEFGATAAELADRHHDLVAMTITDFGADGPYRSWSGTDAVFYAMSTALSRSGPATGTPVLPPVGIASATAAAQAAWAVLAAYYHRLRHGGGEHIDFSRFEAVVQALDPPFGSQGQAAAGLKRTGGWRGRPRNQQIYPTFRCRDGYVRICLLSPRQWRGMRAWLGEPAEFADPEFDSIAARFAATERLNALIGALFAEHTMAHLVEQGQSRGVPIAAVQTPAEALASDHLRTVGALTSLSVAPDASVTVPVGPFVVDGQHRGLRRPAVADAGAQWLGAPNALGRPQKQGVRPFDGLRILDLGVIVAGGELGRLYADLGARVVKVESAAYPDGLRQTAPGQPMSASWALTHRNELSFGVDLRTPEGAEIFTKLVSRTDLVFANFKPGTLAGLGFSFEKLQQINPRLVLAESSAFGDTGPWSAQMGYGPLVRATTGVTRLWRAAGGREDSSAAFFDATTVFPDHVAARITAIATLAALIGRERTGTGAHVHISQAEVAINQLAVAYVAEAAARSGLALTADPAVHAVCPCAGDDEWCVISVRDQTDRDTLAALIGIDLPTEAAALTAILGAYTSGRDKHELTEQLQRAGIPAGPMNRPADVLDDVQLQFRSLYTDLEHPLFDEPMPSETGPAPYRRIPRGELRPAPTAGQHTRDIAHRALGLDISEIDRLIADGVLFESAPVATPTDARNTL